MHNATESHLQCDLQKPNVHEWQNGALVENDRIEGRLLKGDSIDRIEFHETRAGRVRDTTPPDTRSDT